MRVFILSSTSVGEKMFRGPKSKKIEFLTYAMISVVLIIIVFGCINIYKSCKIINAQANADLVNLTENIKQRENDYFHSTEQETEHCRKPIELTIDNKRLNQIAPNAYKYDKYKIPYLSNYLYSIVSPLLLYSTDQVDGIRSIYFILDPKLFVHKYVLGLWYTDIKHENDFKLTDNGPTTDMYPETRSDLEWYYAPKNLKKGVWSKPYIDSDIKINMITYSAPVYSGKTFLGIVGADISIDDIKNYIYKFKIYKTGKAYLIDRDNKIIFAKDYKTSTSTEVIDKNLYTFLNKSLTKEGINLKNEEVRLIKSSSSKKLFAITKLYNGFILVLEVPVNELYSETIKLVTLTSLLLGLAVLIVSLIITLANANIKKINNHLVQREKYTRTILDNIKDGIITINDDFIIESYNPSAEYIFGYSSSEIIGKKLDLLLPCGFYSKKKKDHISEDENYGLKKDGQKFPIEIDVSKINFEDRNLILLVIRDITERKKIDKMKNEFISTVSHELRTPLTAIKGTLGLIIGGAFGVFPEKVINLINVANNNCTRLTNLINDILDLEKIKAGKYEFMYEELEINDIIDQSIALNQTYADQFAIKIRAVKNINKTFIKADKSRLLQIISNLFSNAVKFSNPGDEVTITTEIQQDEVRVSFNDNGIGIPEDAKYKIFQSFSQVDSSDTRSKGGTGLGLSICKILVEEMGGTIGFESTVGKGSTFFFTLPIILKGSLETDNKKLKELNIENFKLS